MQPRAQQQRTAILPSDEWLTAAECYATSKVSKSTFFHWKNTDPAFPRAYRIGLRAVRYKRSEWQAFLERNAV